MEKNKKIAPQDMEALIGQLPLHEQEKLMEQVAEYRAALEREKCQESFMAFVKKMWPGFINGRHHAVMAKAFEDVASGKIKRLAISCPPRHTKSQFGSYLFPAWFLGKFPDKKIMQVSNTAELAVGFGRNVRNLVSSDQYNEIFKNVNLRQDSKSAGRWAVNEYGEYFACIAQDSLVRSSNGLMLASMVKPGDWLVGCGEASKVLSVYANTHDVAYSINGLLCSAEHPVWTQNRGWVYAKDIEPKDVLVVESISDRMKAYIRSFYANLEHADVSPLVQHEVPMREPKGRTLAFIRRSRDICVRAMDVVRKLFGRHGGSSTGNDAGQDRRERTVQPGQLPMGDGSNSGQQQAQQRPAGWENDGRSSEGVRDNAGSNSVQDSQRDGPAVEGEAAQEELRSYGDPENIGWLRRGGAWVIANCGLSFQPGCKGEGTQGYMESFAEKLWQVFGLCVGVRAAGEVKEISSGDLFINYLLEGDHAFFANGVLTHNCGVGGTLTGRGADLVIIDDAHSEQEAKMAAHDPSVYDSTYEWYTSGPRQRLQPGGAIIMIATRWSERDLIGRVIQDAIERGKPDEWRVIEFPAILPSGKPLWPEYWPLDLLDDLKAELPPSKWNAQYQQKPTGEEGALIKREWWNVWEQDEPPRCEFIIQSWDTAFTKNERSDFSACTTWGVFFLNEDPNNPNIILLDAFQKRMEFPELKEKARAHYLEWEPDDCIIEAKAAGASLIQELNQQGDIFVRGYTPSRGTRQQSNDKIARMNSVSPIFQGGKVWAPDTRWARELIDQMASFPNASHDDLADTAVMAITRFRQGGFLRLESDTQDDQPSFRRKAAFY
jgi:predicted phage terminase large subunit-like protein